MVRRDGNADADIDAENAGHYWRRFEMDERAAVVR